MPPQAREDKTPINDELVKIGGFGKFQWFVVISMILGQMCGGFIAHGVAYLQLPPEYPGYLCAMQTDPTNYNTVCAPYYKKSNYTEPVVFFCPGVNNARTLTTPPTYNPDVAGWEVNYGASPRNLYNFYSSLDLGCRPKSATARIAMSVFAGSAIGCLFMPRLGDLIGRKTIFCFSLLFQVPLIATCGYISKLLPIYTASFLFGICIIGRMSCGFLLMMELVPTSHQAKAGAALMVAEGSVAIIWTFYFMWIS